MTNLEQIDEELRLGYGLTRGDANNFSAWLSSVRMSDDTQIHFERDGVTAIVGSNNCGKSTFLSNLSQSAINPNFHPEPQIFHSLGANVSGERADFLDWLCRNTHFGLDSMSPYPRHTFSRMGEQMPLGFFTDAANSPDQPPSFQNIAGFMLKYLPAGTREPTSAQKKVQILDAPSHPLHYLMQQQELLSELNDISKRILGKTLSLDDLNQTVNLKIGEPAGSYPERYEDPEPYQREVDSLPSLDNQGDGVRSLLGILLPLVTAAYSVVVLDEPELFLHPPQSFALGKEIGRIAQNNRLQVILATHDKNLLAGLLDSSAPLSVVRLLRDNQTVTAHQLSSADIRVIWDDPVLKYSNVLDGLFHELVILAENERDCRFYQAALDVRPSKDSSESAARPLPASDVLFVPSAGTSGMPKIARALRALKVPVVASPDIDVLNNETIIRNIVKSLGYDWDDLHTDWEASTAPLHYSETPRLVSTVYQTLQHAMSDILRNPMAQYDASNQRIIREALALQTKPWDNAKHFGIEALQTTGDQPQTVERLFDLLAQRRVVIVRAGELESFGNSLGVEKGKNWLPAALRANLHKTPKVQDHITALLNAYCLEGV